MPGPIRQPEPQQPLALLVPHELRHVGGGETETVSR